MSKNLIRKPFSGLFAEKLWSFCHLFNAIIRISEPKNSLIFRDCVVYWHFYYISVFCVCQQVYQGIFSPSASAGKSSGKVGLLGENCSPNFKLIFRWRIFNNCSERRPRRSNSLNNFECYPWATGASLATILYLRLFFSRVPTSTLL